MCGLDNRLSHQSSVLRSPYLLVNNGKEGEFWGCDGFEIGSRTRAQSRSCTLICGPYLLLEQGGRVTVEQEARDRLKVKPGGRVTAQIICNQTSFFALAVEKRRRI